MESCQFSTPIQPRRNGIETMYQSRTTSTGREEQQGSGPNVPVHPLYSELHSRSAVTSSNLCPYTEYNQSINNLPWRKDNPPNCDYISTSSQHRAILSVSGTTPSTVLDSNFPNHQPVNSIQGLHRSPSTSVPPSVHSSALTQSVQRTATKWPPPCAKTAHYHGHTELEPNAFHNSPCTLEWQYASHQAGYPTGHQLNTTNTGCLNGYRAPTRGHCSYKSSPSVHEIHRGRETGNCMIPKHPCGACGNILCPKSHPMCPNELNVACPHSPTQPTLAIQPCSGLSFPAYASGPAPTAPPVAAPRSEALVGYGGWPASAPPLYFYGKLVSAADKQDHSGSQRVAETPDVGRCSGASENAISTVPVSVTRNQASEPTNHPTNYHNKGSNVCNICGRSYARPSTLKTHLRIHSGEKPYLCVTCGKAFSQTANLTAHMRTHSGEKPFRCTVCHRQFSQSSSVTTHMRTHSGDRPYRCAYCKKAFADSSTLTKHLRIHSGDRPYQCSTCLLRFSQSGNLTRHMKVHQHLREDNV